MAHLARAGYAETWLSPELEFTLFHSPQDAVVQNDVWNPSSAEGSGHLRVVPELLGEHHPTSYRSHTSSSYFAAPPMDETYPFRNEFATMLHELGIRHLPASLGEALEEMESDSLVRRVLGAEATDSFLELKKKEWRNFGNAVTTLEHAMYFHV